MLLVTTESFKNQKRFIAHIGANPIYFVYVKQKKSHMLMFRSNRSQMFFKIGQVSSKISQYSQKKTSVGVSLMKLQGNLIKKRLQHICFPVNTVKFLRTAFFMEHL